MGFSRERDSTTRPSHLAHLRASRYGGQALFDWLLAGAIAVTALVAAAGIDFRLAGVSVRSHSWVRMALGVAALFLVRQRFGIASYASWLTRLAMVTAICGSIATWFRFLLTTIGGADSYGYVSASKLIAGGHLIDRAPIADWLAAANRLTIASPLGWAPAPDGSGIVPTYPIGLSTVMAVFSAIGGSSAVFFVSPAMALLTLFLVYRLAREWFDPETALFAAAIVAWNPVFIAYAKQPMSDMTATMWIMLAAAFALRATASQAAAMASAFAAGLAAGAAVITRPALLIAAAVIPFVACKGEHRLRRLFTASIGLAVGLSIQMTIQQQLFGSPFATGYGSSAALFSPSHLTTNLKIFFVRHGWQVVGPLFVPGLIIGLFAAKPDPRSKPLLIFCAVLLPYLFYLPFDHWETLRFLLPGLVPLTITATDGLMHIARVFRQSAITTALVVVMLIIVAGPSESLLRHSSAWEIASLEERYPLAGDWINVNTPPNSIVLANQHSGSLRWYGKRQTLRWNFIDPRQLETIVNELQSHGATVYVALEGDEVKMFDDRFAGVIDQFQVDHVGQVRNVSFRRLLAAK